MTGPGRDGVERLRRGRTPFERFADRAARPLLVVYAPVLVLATHWPGLALPSATPVFQTDKLVHVFAFGFLGWLALHCGFGVRLLGSHGSRLVTTLAVVVFALVDEYTQQFVNRYTGVEDAVANTIGVLTAFLISRPRHQIPRRDVLAWVSRVLNLVITPGLILLFLLPAANPYLIRLAEAVGLSRYGADKPGHLYVGAAWTVLLATAMPAGITRPRLSFLLTVVVMAASAPLIEWAQRGSGRGFEAADVYWHELGLLAALMAWALLAAAQPLLRRVGIGTRTHDR
ncbi:VanZ family protein [Mucisphaera calidilacus]|uniref:VanZ like family protein n=1 Tax=Mucisphaera calidilacus TaxID=2527982 RepID=A0A518C0G3_9BACT|nr:VanZ family protein [Mucisphaera calidilacus]QDU72716.1 VanZ like family protein [Mucisphaera calidilacus]